MNDHPAAIAALAARNTPTDAPDWVTYSSAARNSDDLPRCTDGCLSAHRRWPAYDESDRDAMTCYRCGGLVCVACQTSPVEAALTVCDRCGHAAADLSRL